MKNISALPFYDLFKDFVKKDQIDFEFYAFEVKESMVSFQKESLKNCSSSVDKLFNLRVMKGQKSGTSYTKDFSKEGLSACYQQALDSLRLSDKEEFGSLSEKENYRDFSKFYDSGFAKLSMEDKIEKAKQINKACLDFDKRIQPMFSVVQDKDQLYCFGNSKGQRSSYASQDVIAYCYSLASDQGKRATAVFETNGKNYEDLSFFEIGQKSASKALKKLNHFIPKTKRYPVIFQSGQASASLLKRLVAFLDGKLVSEGLSLFKDSLDKEVFSKNVFVYDDPFAIWGLCSSPFDGEGFASEKTALIEEGVLKNYLTNSFFAKKLNVAHTKKAAWTNEGQRGLSASNLVMKEGESSLDHLIRSCPQVILIDHLKGLAGYNSVSGDFSIESEGYLWDHGEERPICGFTVSGNLKEIFSNILHVAKDSMIYNGRFKVPSFLVSDLTISGK